MPSSPRYASSIQNLKTVADKISWRVQYQDRVVDGKFQVRVVLTCLLYTSPSPRD